MIKDILNANENITAGTTAVNKLKAVLPQCFDKDGNLYFDKLKELLRDEVSFADENYGLNFLGKSYARLLQAMETDTVITPDEDHNKQPQNADSENIYITGDNLDALKHLLKSYENKIKCIYIDPPYNTGSDGFVYNDRFTFTKETLAQKLSISEETAERILELTNSGSASHSAWLTFMYPRLLLARDLLTEDGVIFISIDDNEQANLKLLCDDVFGEQNFVACLSVENNPKGRKNSAFISVSSEYCIIYTRKKENSHFIENVPKNADDMIMDENGVFVHNSGKRVLVGENNFNNYVTNVNSDKNYSVYYNRLNNDIKLRKEDIGKFDKGLIENGYKKYSSFYNGRLVENTYTYLKFKELFEKNALEFAEEKIYEKNFNDTIRLKSLLLNKKYIAIVNGQRQEYSMELTTTGANTYLKSLFKTEKSLFDAPKNLGFLKLLLTLFDDKKFNILDFFSGSSTTADAIMQLNAKDGGNRKFILVQLPEATKEGSEARQAGYETIDQIGRERIKRAAAKIKEEYPDTTADLGFKHFRLNQLNNTQLSQIETFSPELNMVGSDDLLQNFGTPTVLTTWLNRDGYGLNPSVKVENLANYTAYICGANIYLLENNFDNQALMELCRRYEEDEDFAKITNIIVFGYSFSYTDLQALQDNIKKFSVTRNSRINVEIRY